MLAVVGATAHPVEGVPVVDADLLDLRLDADQGQLGLHAVGVEAEIQEVSINNRDTFHRVRSGPYHSQRQLNAVRNLAKENNIATLVIKLKQ